MPITFEEVTAEVAPDAATAAPPREAPPESAAPDALGEKIQALMVLRAERQQRSATD